jgi:type I restriction enzyme S subunit
MVFRTKLADICSDISYGYTASAEAEAVGPKFLRITDIQGGVVDWSEVPYCKIDDRQLSKNLLEIGDIVVARTGNSTGENYIYNSAEKSVFASYLIRFRVNQELANPYFVWLQMRTHSWWGFVSGSKSGSAQAGANAKVLGLFEVELPERQVQDKIVSLIFDYFYKIELNKQTNQTLEQMAQALFKSWFVDFDPVIDNALAAGNWNASRTIPDELQARAEVRKKVIAERATSPKLKPLFEDIQQLFPSEFEQCGELTIGIAGWIPKGWECCPMSEIVDIASSKRVFAKDYVEEGVPFYRGKEITELSKGNKINTEIFISEDRYQELKEKAGAPKQGDILITSVGTIGNTYLVKESDKFYFKDGNLTWVKGYKKGFIPFYFNEWFKSRKAKDAIERIKIGTTQQAITIKALNGVKMLSPESKLVQIFEKQAASIFDKHNANIEQINCLSQLRDSLLPKLISGEITLLEPKVSKEA